jgi:predicted  nucleic acid-binding Zn-ribbon protein
MYLPFIAPVEKAKEDKFNRAGTKQYWAAGDFLFPNLNKDKYSSDSLDENSNLIDHYISIIDSNQMSKDEAYDDLVDQGVEQNMIDSIIASAFPMDVNESKLRKVIRESIEKELASINKEAEMEILDSKLEKIQSAIEKRQSQLTKLDEDEDMKALTDKTKVKQIQKDIKALEKAKSKIEKQLSKKDKPAKSEIIDEDEVLNEIDPKGTEAARDASKEIDNNFKSIKSTIDSIELEEDENGIPQEIINQVVKMHVEDGMEIEDVASKFPEMYDEVVEFLDGYDLGLDYDI